MHSTEKNKKHLASDFWLWFSENKHKYMDLGGIDPSKKDTLLNNFENQLHKYCSKLFFQIGGHPDSEKRELIITASGNIEYFIDVSRLVSIAPKIENWQIIALKQPMKPSIKMQYNNIDFDTSDIYYDTIDEENKMNSISIDVQFPNFVNGKEKTFQFVANNIIEAMIGEYQYAVFVDNVYVSKLNMETDPMPVNDLKNYIDWLISKGRLNHSQDLQDDASNVFYN